MYHNPDLEGIWEALTGSVGKFWGGHATWGGFKKGCKLLRFDGDFTWTIFFSSHWTVKRISVPCLNGKNLQILKVIISNPLNFKIITISHKKGPQRPWHLGVNRARMVSLQVCATNTLSQIKTPPSVAWTWRKRGTTVGSLPKHSLRSLRS